jgi:multidrug efflux pump subunit AcrA (membrane-fusion protein)
MNWKRVSTDVVRVVFSISILAAGVAAYAAISHKDPAPPREPPALGPLLVKTVAVKTHSSSLDLVADGLVIPYREVKVASEVDGRITLKSPHCRSGMVVKKGELLFEVDPLTYKLETGRLEIEVAQADATLNELETDIQSTRSLLLLAEEQLDLKHKNSERVRSLYERRAVNDADLESSRREEIESINSVTTLKNQIQKTLASQQTQIQAKKLAEIKLQRAQLDLKRTRVYSPMDGVVISCTLEENSYVQPGAELILLEDTSAIEVRCNLPMEDVEWVLRQSEKRRSTQTAYELPNTDVTIRYRIGTRNYDWQGKLASYDGIGLDERTRTVPVRIRVDAPMRTLSTGDTQMMAGPPALVRGMFVQVLLHIKPNVSPFSVPEQAIQPGNIVWCVRDDKLCKVPVSIAQANAKEVLLDAQSTPLSVGEHLVISPMPAPFDGMPVTQEGSL